MSEHGLDHDEVQDQMMRQFSPFRMANVEQGMDLRYGPTDARLSNVQYMQPQVASPSDPTLNQINRQGDRNARVYPRLVIMEQPKSRGLRFRYECEGRSAGAIHGENSSGDNRTYPTVKIENMDTTTAVVIASCVSKGDPPRPHPHNLTGESCKKGVCTVRISNTSTVSFRNIGIQCVKKKEVKASLLVRAENKVDPFSQGFDDKNHDLTTVRICFQAYVPDQTGKYCRAIRPIVSHCIFDKKAISDLVICRISKQAGKVVGGDEMFIFTEKIQKDNIQVRFFEMAEEGLVWEAYGDFGQGDVHRQYAIVIHTPPYRNKNIDQPVTVYFQLKRPRDGEVSEPKPFQYIPDDPDPDGLRRKRRKHMTEYTNDITSSRSSAAASGHAREDVKEILKEHINKLARRDSQQSTLTSDSMYPVGGVPSNLPPQYAFNNPGGATSTSPHRMADQFQTLVNATINTSTVDASQLEFASLNSADLLPIDGSTASFITDTMQPSGDSTYSDMFGNISIPSFPETELQADVAQMFPEPSVGAHEVYPPK